MISDNVVANKLNESKLSSLQDGFAPPDEVPPEEEEY